MATTEKRMAGGVEDVVVEGEGAGRERVIEKENGENRNVFKTI